MQFNTDELGARSESRFCGSSWSQRLLTQCVGNRLQTWFGRDRDLTHCFPVTWPINPRYLAQCFTVTWPIKPRYLAQSFSRKSLIPQVVSALQQTNKDLNKQTTKGSCCCFSWEGGQG